MSNETPGTHVATTDNKRKPMPMDVLRNNLEGEFMNTAVAHFQGNKQMALSFKTACIDYVRKTPKLLECDRVSLMSAFVTASQFKFMPSGVSGECSIIPYDKDAKFQLGYQGLITLMWRTGKIKSIKAMLVYSNETFEYTEGLETRLHHVPTKFGEKRGEPIGVYAVAETTTGGRVFNVMSEEQVMAIKAMSKAKDKPDSPWNSKDPEKWMWKKTCLIQLSKLLPKTQELQQAIEKDYEGEGAERPLFDAEGPATAKAHHGPANSVVATYPPVVHDMPPKESNPAAEDMPPDLGPDIHVD